MQAKKVLTLLLSAALALAVLAGCGRTVYSSQAVSAANKAQTGVDFATSTELDNALRKAVQAGDDMTVIRNALLEELGYQNAAYFSASGVNTARTGQHAVQVYRVAGSASASADSIAKEIANVLNALRSGGEYTGNISMVSHDGSYYIAVDLTIVKAPTGSSSGGDDGGDDGSGDEPTKPEPEEPTLQSIGVTTQPNKTEYFVGDTFDPTGMVVTAYYSNNTSETVNDYSYSPATMTAGTTEVVISYQDKTCSVSVTVITASILDVEDIIGESNISNAVSKVKGSASIFYRTDPDKTALYSGTKQFSQALQKVVSAGGSVGTIEENLATTIAGMLKGNFILPRPDDSVTSDEDIIIHTSAENNEQLWKIGSEIDSTEWVSWKRSDSPEDQPASLYYYCVKVYQYDSEEQMKNSLANDIAASSFVQNLLGPNAESSDVDGYSLTNYHYLNVGAVKTEDGKCYAAIMLLRNRFYSAQ